MDCLQLLQQLMELVAEVSEIKGKFDFLICLWLCCRCAFSWRLL